MKKKYYTTQTFTTTWTQPIKSPVKLKSLKPLNSTLQKTHSTDLNSKVCKSVTRHCYFLFLDSCTICPSFQWQTIPVHAYSSQPINKDTSCVSISPIYQKVPHVLFDWTVHTVKPREQFIPSHLSYSQVVIENRWRTVRYSFQSSHQNGSTNGRIETTFFCATIIFLNVLLTAIQTNFNGYHIGILILCWNWNDKAILRQ